MPLSAATKRGAGRALPIDPTFNGGAEVALKVGDRNVSGASDVVALSDGRIAVLHDVTILVYNSDGTADAGFDGDGVVELQPESVTKITSIHAAAEGGIVAVGVQGGPDKSSPILFRVLRDGRVDRSWGSAGQVVVPHEPLADSSENTESRIDIGVDGSIAIASLVEKRGIYSIVISKLDRRGKFLRSFGRRGMQRMSYRPKAGYGNRLMGVEFDSRGRIVTTGFIASSQDCESDDCYHDGVPPYAFVKRITSTGRTDRSFAKGNLAIKKMSGNLNGVLVTKRGIFLSDKYGHAGLILNTGRSVKKAFEDDFGWSDNTEMRFGSSILHQRRNGSVIATGSSVDLGGFGERAWLVFRKLGPRGFSKGGAGNTNSSAVEFSYGYMRELPHVAFDFDHRDRPLVLANRFDTGTKGPHRSYLARLQP